MKRVGVIGAGRMALRRGKAFLETKEAKIVAVASRNIEHAKKVAKRPVSYTHLTLPTTERV